MPKKTDETELLVKAYLPGVDLNGHSHILKNVRMSIRHKDFALPLDVWHLLYSKLRIELLRKGLFSVHGALVGDTLIVGHSGTGKTSILLELAKKGMKVFSGNKTVVSLRGGRLNALAGTRAISARTKDGWRRYFLPAQQYSRARSVQIKNIVIVRLNDGVGEFHSEEPASALHALYPYFLDVVNADTVLDDGVFVGTPPKGAQKKLAVGLRQALKKVPAYVIVGSKSFITQKIAKL